MRLPLTEKEIKKEPTPGNALTKRHYHAWPFFIEPTVTPPFSLSSSLEKYILSPVMRSVHVSTAV